MNGESRPGRPGEEITDVGVDEFVATMKFVAHHDLWDEAREFLASEGVTTVPVGSVEIRTFKRLVSQELLGGDRMQGRSADQAAMIAECACAQGTAHGYTGQGAEYPHTTVTDGGTE